MLFYIVSSNLQISNDDLCDSQIPSGWESFSSRYKSQSIHVELGIKVPTLGPRNKFTLTMLCTLSWPRQLSPPWPCQILGRWVNCHISANQISAMNAVSGAEGNDIRLWWVATGYLSTRPTLSWLVTHRWLTPTECFPTSTSSTFPKACNKAMRPTIRIYIYIYNALHPQPKLLINKIKIKTIPKSHKK